MKSSPVHGPKAAPKARRVGIAAGFALALSWTGSAAAQSELPVEVGYSYGELETPRTTAMGGAIRSISNGPDAILMNPANMAIAKLYHISAIAQIYPEAGRQSYGGAVVDSLISSSGIAGGFSGAWSQQDPDGMKREWLDLRFGMAMPIGDIIYLGATGRYYAATQSGFGPLGFSKASGGLPESKIIETVTFDAGVTLRPLPELMLSVVGHNLTDQDTGLLPLMGAFSAGFAMEDFSLAGDVVLEARTFDENVLRFQGGGEILIADRVPVRAGYRFDQGLETHAVSGGVGYIDQKFGIDVAVRRGVAGQEYTMISFGFTLHIEAMGLNPG